MPVICRLLALSPERAAALIAKPRGLAEAVASAEVYSDVYRYWHGIHYLLHRRNPAESAAHFLTLGESVSAPSGTIPAARVIFPAQVVQLDVALDAIEPEDLIPHYDAADLDSAEVYPNRWVEWEETFDPLGQLLEHYSFLQSFAKGRADDGEALLLYFVHDGDDD